ncbi:CLUMA_CG018890, isoform A [Clunio marinus]|uniref:CLUMA_CG018890, isoform A n=1 Tax=Clunio marinus TaxID=568069 RepID=A0A1J1J0K4_9DIPT|nr:CLUMA_CG018890, isoform A [Clunio marinus]
MQGLNLASLKKNPALIPLYICVGAGMFGAFFYTMRLAIKNPDVSWRRGANPEPNEEYRTKQYKFYSPIRDYSNIDSPAPKYKD